MRALSLVAALSAALAIGVTSVPAKADWDGGGWHHRHHHGWAVNGFFYQPPVYYAPPPVYYGPPPAYYAPPPVYYAPPPVYAPRPFYQPAPLSGIGLGFSFGH